MVWTEAAQAKYKRRATRYESDLTDVEWERFAPLLPAPAIRRARPFNIPYSYRLIRACLLPLLR